MPDVRREITNAEKDEVMRSILEAYARLNLRTSLGINAYGGEALYCIVKLLKPDVVIETGVSAGVSTSYILRAMRDNKRGMLYSIDVPGDVESGILVPESLRDRWKLILGESKELLPSLLGRLMQVDIFIHDSDHSYENMIFEFETTWPFIRAGGVLVSDDSDSNTSWVEFTTRHHVAPIELFAHSMSATRKQ